MEEAGAGVGVRGCDRIRGDATPSVLSKEKKGERCRRNAQGGKSTGAAPSANRELKIIPTGRSILSKR